MKSYTITTVVLALLLVVSGLSSCGGDDDNGGTKSTLSGSLTLAAAPDGVKAYLKLVTPGEDSTETALYFVVSSAFSGGSATYSLSGVENGSYTGWAFIDVNGNAAGDATSMPDTGDYVTQQGGDITISGDTTSDIPENAWIQI